MAKVTSATLNEPLWIGKPGITFEVWSKRRPQKKLGSLTVTVAGLRWLAHSGKKERQRPWTSVKVWFEE